MQQPQSGMKRLRQAHLLLQVHQLLFLAGVAALLLLVPACAARPARTMREAEAAGAAAAGAAAAAATVPFPLPPWARAGGTSEAALINRDLVYRQNQSGRRMDVVMYGDSITYRINNAPEVNATQHWNATLGWDRAVQRPLDTAALGAPGSTVEGLAYRLMSGDERFDLAPRVVVILIGINNEPKNQPRLKERISVLLFWMSAVWPRTRVILMAPLPSRFTVRSQLLRQMWQAVASGQDSARRNAGLPGLVFSTCGGLLDPRDRTYFSDGLHPLAPGYQRFLSCLVQPVSQALADSRADPYF